jgi:hypothetical protein
MKSYCSLPTQGLATPKPKLAGFSHKGRFKNLSNPLWHAPSCTCELNIPRLILPPPPSLNPSTFMVNFPIVFRPRDSTYTCALLAAQDIARRRMRLFS